MLLMLNLGMSSSHFNPSYPFSLSCFFVNWISNQLVWQRTEHEEEEEEVEGQDELDEDKIT